MYIEKVVIENFKCYKGRFSLALNRGANILVGNNEAGKSTILEATHLALTGILNGRYLKNELSQYLFNREIEKAYIASLGTSSKLPPPYILIELFLAGEECSPLALLKGNDNSDKVGNCGVFFCIEFDEQYQSEYEELLNAGNIKTIPIEYYKVTWRSFARDAITARSIPVKSALIDSASVRVQNGSDVYISRIIRETLEDKERVEISQAHRQMKETFMDTPSVKAINSKITASANITDKEVKISVDLSTQNAWEMSLMTYLDEIPFHYVGKGEQSIVKTNLALSHKKSQEANIILLEEPENHLSHSKLNELIGKILDNLESKQLIVTTHSSFVANKLGLGHLILLNNMKSTRLNELSDETKAFFLKLAGYDTLRMILCSKAILVEGDSDELVVQKAYRLNNQGKLPIENGVDVISVGTSFLRFLEVAEKIDKNVAVVTDNDGDVEAVRKKYVNYIGDKKKQNITIYFDENVSNGVTLEPQLLKVNDLAKLNDVLEKPYTCDEDLLKFMLNNKTFCALKIFDTEKDINIPQYILDAIK
ncbi:MAG: AAA family ATPase [Alphaproteobacteria bacterium]|nr:AAA family ATPase [Alphaproteobacteria bacterium]